MLLLLLSACGSSFVPGPVAEPVGHALCGVAHPKATCGQGVVVDESHGPLSRKAKGDRWADIAVPYEVDGASHAMRIRVHLKKVAPCRIAVDVLEDDGPSPKLLDNAVVSRVAGQTICKKLTGG